MSKFRRVFKVISIEEEGSTPTIGVQFGSEKVVEKKELPR